MQTFGLGYYFCIYILLSQKIYVYIQILVFCFLFLAVINFFSNCLAVTTSKRKIWSMCNSWCHPLVLAVLLSVLLLVFLLSFHQNSTSSSPSISKERATGSCLSFHSISGEWAIHSMSARNPAQLCHPENWERFWFLMTTPVTKNIPWCFWWVELVGNFPT